MSSKTLEQYLVAAIERGQIDHALRAHRGLDGKITFYVRPLAGDGETLDFVVRGNALVLNQTSDSDVPELIAVNSIGEASGAAHNPAHLAVDLSHAIARLAETAPSLRSTEQSLVNGLINSMATKATTLLQA